MSGFASIHVHDGATSQAVTSTPAKLTGFATAGVYDPGGSLSAANDVANDQIAVKAGHTYRIDFNLSLKLDANSAVQVHARLGTTELTQIAGALESVSTTQNTHINVSGGGFYTPAADGNISLYIEGTNNVAVTPVHGNLTVQEVA